jgi:hypothetical protein
MKRSPINEDTNAVLDEFLDRMGEVTRLIHQRSLPYSKFSSSPVVKRSAFFSSNSTL